MRDRTGTITYTTARMSTGCRADTQRTSNSGWGGNQGKLLRGGGSNEPGKEGLRTGGGKDIIGRGSRIFKSLGLQESAVQGPARA